MRSIRVSNIGQIFPNGLKYPQIRSVFLRRIYGFISVLVQTLSQQIAILLSLGFVLVAQTSQSDLEEFHDISGDDNDGPSLKGLIYARVSSHKQTDNDDGDNVDDTEEGSIQGQIDELREIKNKMNIELAHEPIIDRAKSGTDFDRDGIQKVFQLSQRDDVGYLFVEKIDRIGRSAPETLYFIYLLQSHCDVTLVTASGERDISNVHGLMHTTLLSLMAEVQNDIRTSKAQKERVRNFVQHHDWKAYSNIIPIGYEEDNNGWLKPDPDEVDVVQDMFETFNDPECREYAETRRKINNEYDDILDGHRVKTLLTNPVYVGRPQIPEEWVDNLSYDNVVEDPDLQIIDEDVFEKAQEIVNEKDRKHSSDEDTNEVIDFIEEFDLFSVVATSEPVTLLHDCGTPMVKSGQRELDGGCKTHRYYCSECDEYRKWPKEYEYERMRIVQLLLDDDVDFLEVVKEGITGWKN